MGETINIMEYLEIFKKRKKVIFIILFMFLLVGGLLQYKHNKSYLPTYSSTVSVRINTNKNIAKQQTSPEEASKDTQSGKGLEKENTTQQDSQSYMRSSLESSALNQSIAEKYSSVAVSKRAMMELVDKLGLNISPEIITKKITVVPQENLMEFIDITVIDKNPELALKIASTMPEIFNNEIIRVIGVDCVEVLYDATEPILNLQPQDNTFRNFALIGMVLAIFIVFLLECLDNKVVTPEDVEKYWGLPVIGIVPFEKEKTKGKRVVKVNQLNESNKEVKINIEGQINREVIKG